MTQPKPTATGTGHILPFDKLSPRDFERLCLCLVEREGYERAEHLGAAGSEQGRDIIAWREGKLWAFQCKRVQRFGPQDALAEVAKVLTLPQNQRPEAFVFIVACDVSANTRQQVRERCTGKMECHFWTKTELDARLRNYPECVEEFFDFTSDKAIKSGLLHIQDVQGTAFLAMVLVLEVVYFAFGIAAKAGGYYLCINPALCFGPYVIYVLILGVLQRSRRNLLLGLLIVALTIVGDLVLIRRFGSLLP